jgi:hypothetical protein
LVATSQRDVAAFELGEFMDEIGEAHMVDLLDVGEDALLNDVGSASRLAQDPQQLAAFLCHQRLGVGSDVRRFPERPLIPCGTTATTRLGATDWVAPPCCVSALSAARSSRPVPGQVEIRQRGER